MKGQFTISLDTEIAWGKIESNRREQFYPLFENTKDVIERLIDLFDQYEIPATWGIVGRLVEKEKPFISKLENFYPNQTDALLYNDNKRNKSDNSYLYYPKLLDLLKQAKVEHDIGSHSYSHIVFNNVRTIKGVEKEVAQKDFIAGQKLFSNNGLTPKSFIYPLNAVGHTELLKESGFTCYRGDTISSFSNYPSFLRRLLRQLELFFPICPETIDTSIQPNKLVCIPGSMHFKIIHLGIKKHIPFSVLERKAIKGLNKAVTTQKCFHLWFHPFDFGWKTQKHFDAFEKTLEHAATLRQKGKLDIKTMAQMAELTNIV